MMVSCGGYKYYYDGDLSIVGHRIYYESQDRVTYPRNQTSMFLFIHFILLFNIIIFMVLNSHPNVSYVILPMFLLSLSL